MMRFFGLLLSLVGGGLLLVAVIGHWTDLGNYESAQPREWERFDPKLVGTIDSFSKLLEVGKSKLPAKPSEAQTMAALYDTVAERFTHKEAVHTFFSNWLIYLSKELGIYSRLMHIRNVDTMLAKGHSLFCDQSSHLLMSLTLANGIKVRHVGLEGHVVMEAWYDSDWHLYDPDLEVVPLDAAGQVLSVQELALDEELLEKYYGRHKMTKVVATEENNSYVSHPQGAWVFWKSNYDMPLEKLMEDLKFFVPVVLIAVGFWLTIRRKRRFH